eukprot:PhM_4_TR15183/c7_g2_i1/m.41431
MSYGATSTAAYSPYNNNPSQGFWYRAPSARREVSSWVAQGEWASPLCCSFLHDPIFFLAACLCPWCTAYAQRQKLLLGQMQYYECCAGINGRMCTERLNGCTQGNESCCLALEVVCCLGCAVHGNRWMVQQHYGLENTCFDVFIMYLACVCSCLASITGEESLENISDLIYHLMIGCMLTQHEVQMQSVGYPVNSSMV